MLLLTPTNLPPFKLLSYRTVEGTRLIFKLTSEEIVNVTIGEY